MKNNRFAVTLTELILVVSMVAILAVIGTSGYSKSKNKALSREAIANLKLIAAAERIYKMESSDYSYVSCSGVDNCNDWLNLNLNATNWGYGVGASGSGSGAMATITATLNTAPTCTYTLGSANFDGGPDKAVVCPDGMN